MAFWIDALWVGLEEARDERESLELVSRDLNSAITQLDEFVRFSEEKGTFALSVAEALSRDDPGDRLELSRRIQLASDRRTVVLPSAAFTDLVSTGNLRVVRNRALRDAIVRFYESAERTERILEKNNSLFVDQYMFGLFGDGLLTYRAGEGQGFVEAQVEAIDIVASRIGAEFDYGSDYLWSLEPSSREWHRVRSSHSLTGQVMFINLEFAQALIEEAENLVAQIQEELEVL